MISYKQLKQFITKLISIILGFSKEFIVNSSEEKEAIYSLCKEWMTKKHFNSILNSTKNPTKNM